MFKVTFNIAVEAQDERCWFYEVDRIIVNKFYWIPDEFPVGVSREPTFVCPLTRDIDWRSEKTIDDSKTCPCRFCMDLETNADDESKFFIRLNRENNSVYTSCPDSTTMITLERDDFPLETYSDSEDSSEDLKEVILDRNANMKFMGEIVTNFMSSHYRNLTYDPHYNCYCKTQKVCGCGCDPKHDGW